MPPAAITLPVLTGDQANAWGALFDLAPSFGKEWTLIGGQMVLLHQAERSEMQSEWVPRWSYDLDVIVNIRVRRSVMNDIDSALRQHDFVQVPQGIEHRYWRDSDRVTIDVLAPDHIGRHIPRLGTGHTVQTAGGTQALKRTEWVQVAHNGSSVSIPRPSLVGAILIKCAAASGLPGKRGSQRHVDDIVTLSALLAPRDVEEAILSRGERKRLRMTSDLVVRSDVSNPTLQQAAVILKEFGRPPAAPAKRSSTRARSATRQRSTATVRCGASIGKGKSCRRLLNTQPCPHHKNSPGSVEIRRRPSTNSLSAKESAAQAIQAAATPGTSRPVSAPPHHT